MKGAEFEVSFTDQTILEANGKYEEVVRLMEQPQKILGKMTFEPPKSNWTVKSNVTILHSLGFAMFTCDFRKDGSLVITNFASSSKDIYTLDARCLTAWAHAYGWKTPEPTSVVIESWKDFWKMQWETHIVDSSYFDKKYGSRNPPVVDEPVEDEDSEE